MFSSTFVLEYSPTRCLNILRRIRVIRFSAHILYLIASSFLAHRYFAQTEFSAEIVGTQRPALRLKPRSISPTAGAPSNTKARTPVASRVLCGWIPNYASRQMAGPLEPRRVAQHSRGHAVGQPVGDPRRPHQDGHRQHDAAALPAALTLAKRRHYTSG